MKNILNANIRDHSSKGESHRLRAQGKIPAVLYGMKDPNMLVEFGEMELNQVLNSAGEHGLVSVNLSGNVVEAIIKEVQREPITRKITHMDLQRVNNLQLVKTKVPVVLTGEEYYKNTGTIVQQQVNQVEVECTPDRIPKHICVDISHLDNKHRITVGDLEVGEEISILNNPQSTVVSLTYSKNTVTEEESPNSAMAMHYDNTL